MLIDYHEYMQYLKKKRNMCDGRRKVFSINKIVLKIVQEKII